MGFGPFLISVMKKIHYGDSLERDIASLLDNKGIHFIHESENKGQVLDFYLPSYDVYIEVKQYFSERITKQLASRDNVICVQGKKSLALLKVLLK